MRHVQQALDFETGSPQANRHVAESTSLPPPPASAPRLVRPDRQLTYCGVPSWEWPQADEDRDRITVDRLREDIDGPAHRFVIERGDRVEVYLGPNRYELGIVTGISLRHREVRVSHREGSAGLWYGVGAIYPTPETTEARPPIRRTPNAPETRPADAPSTATSPPPVEHPPMAVPTYSFDDYKRFRREYSAGGVPFEGYRAQFRRLRESQGQLQTELKFRFKAPELALLASRMGSPDARRSTKDENAAAIIRRMLSSFLLDGVVSYAIGERYEDAVTAKVLAVTAGEYAAAIANRQAADRDHAKALANPESFFEFRTFLQHKCEADLSDEQLARYDALHADSTRERRAAEAKTTVEQFQHDELMGYEFQMHEGFHDKRQCPLWIVQLSSRVERPAFDELNAKAKQLGGWYSSFKKADAGFQFLKREHADRFCALLSGDADRTDVLEARKERKEQTAAERLHELATDLATRAEETIERSNDALQNTARRADIQAGVRGRAYADQALSRTLHSIAEALSRGEAKYLDGIRHKTHVETLETILRLAKWARLRSVRRGDGESTFQLGLRIDGAEDQPIGPADVRYADYPFPIVYRRCLDDLIAACRSKKGAKLAAEKMRKRLSRESGDLVTFQAEHDVAALLEFIDRARAVGADVERIDSVLEKHQRLQRAKITDVHELRAALREYLAHRTEARGDDPVKIAERELIGQKLPGFFPTPRPVIDRMLELAQIEPAHRILEPSCGMGSILDAIRDTLPEAKVTAVEQNLALADILAAKGYEVEFADFLQHQGVYDRILMNPPFEGGSDAAHVRHAFEQLAPGGRLVSVVSEGLFFRVDNKSVAFRDWLEDVGAEVAPLPDDAFCGTEVFRETSVRTRLVVIDKEAP